MPCSSRSVLPSGRGGADSLSVSRLSAPAQGLPPPATSIAQGKMMRSTLDEPDTVVSAMAQIVLPPPPARRRDAVKADGGYGVSDTPDWRYVDWPAHLHTIDIGGTPVNYADIGGHGDH